VRQKEREVALCVRGIEEAVDAWLLTGEGECNAREWWELATDLGVRSQVYEVLQEHNEAEMRAALAELGIE